MNIEIKTAPTVGAITLPEAKKHLEIDASYTEKDDEISSDIVSVTDNLSSLTGKRIMTQTIEMYFDSWDELEDYVIKQGIIKSIIIKYLDEDKVSQGVADTNYTLLGINTYFARVVFNDDYSNPEIWGDESIILTVACGENTATKQEQLMVKRMLSQMYDNYKADGMLNDYVRDNKYR